MTLSPLPCKEYMTVILKDNTILKQQLCKQLMINQPTIHLMAIKTQMILMTNQPSPKAKFTNALNAANGTHEYDDAKTHGLVPHVVILAYNPKTSPVSNIILGEDAQQSYVKHANAKVIFTLIAWLPLFINN